MYDIAFGILIGLLFIILLVLFCVLIVKLYINKIKNYTRLIYQKDIDFQMALNETILETQEQVLHNISQDLHDDAGQQLTYINFQLENLKLDYPNLKDVLEPLSQSADHLSHSIRSISHSLNLQTLLQQDVLKAIEVEVARLDKNPKINVRCVIEKPSRQDFSTNEKIVIYRIFQEVINNCFKHAKASEINIQITTLPQFIMRITDNGKGFDYEATQVKKPTLGLRSMVNRATIINYNLDIQSKVAVGTTIILSEKK
ncbi:MAG: ATP-binding protein [Flavobacterium sp.]